MRVAVLTNDYPQEGDVNASTKGGAGRIAALQVAILRNAEHDVRVWHQPLTWAEQTPWRRLLAHVQDRKPRMELVADILAWKPDVLITHNLTGCGFGTPRLIQEKGVHWIHVLHDVQLFDPSGQLTSAASVTIWQIFWTWIRRSAFGNPQIITSPTAWLFRKHLRREFFLSGATRCEILPNPVPPYHLVERGIHFPFRLLYVGRIAPDKGSVFLRELMQHLPIAAELHVVGEGTGRRELERLVGRVRFYGHRSQDDVRKMMEEHDVLLVPSLIEENQPNVILEAASCGLPVIASDKGGIAETMGRGGIICPPDHLPSWIRAIESLQEETFYRHVSENMETIARRHDPETYREGFLSLLTSNR